jgi:hypothetical protein
MMMTAKTPSVSTIGNSNNNNNNNSNNISNNNQSSSSSIRKKEQIKRRPRRGRLLLYSVILFAICWLQIAVNVFTYFSSHYEQQQDQTQPSAVARFSSYYSSDGNNNNTTDGNIEQHHQQQPPPSPSLEVQLSQLQTRLRLLQQQQHQQEDINYDINTNTNTNSTTTTTTTAPKVMFIPFTIRDAQRTVPTQIPHGFHIFDFIDLYASDSDGEQNQTQTEITDTLTNTTTAITTKSKLYHNGKPVIVDTGVVRKEEEECRGYTKKCYRTKMLRVIKYLQSLQQQNTNTNTNTNNYEYYYFYMEADNDLCVPLNEIKQIALKYRRYFTNTGEGIGSASGWIMSQQFLNDFYSYWYNIFNNNNNNNNNNNTLSSSLLTEEQKLEPNTVASVLLKQKQNWSVTRRYLTSHSILVGNTNDASSISNLYEHVEEEEGNITTATNSSNSSSSSKVAIVVATTTAPGNNNAAAADGADEQHPDSSMGLLEKLTSKKLLSASVLDDKKSLSSVMEPARYLPRCLEPHRGIWPDKNKTKEEDNNYDNKSNNNNNNNVAIDMYHWDFFDYDLCPESDIFPCKEGQLGIK